MTKTYIEQAVAWTDFERLSEAAVPAHEAQDGDVLTLHFKADGSADFVRMRLSAFEVHLLPSNAMAPYSCGLCGQSWPLREHLSLHKCGLAKALPQVATRGAP